MNKILILVLLAFLMSIVSVSAAELDIRMDDYDPDPVEPGEKFIIDFNIENLELATMTYEVRLFTHDNFYLRDSTLKTIELDSRESDDVRFRVEVDEDADETSGVLTFAYREEGQTDWIKKDFDVEIDSKISLNVVSVSSNPNVLEKGEQAELKITLENDGDVDLKDIKVKLNLDNIPLAPYNSVSLKEVSRLDSNDKETITMYVVALDNAESGIYKIPINIEYEDNNGKDYTKNSFISLRIGGI